MKNNNIERMKKLIEEKKNRSTQHNSIDDKSNVKVKNLRKKAFNNTKRGGAFDK